MKRSQGVGSSGKKSSQKKKQSSSTKQKLVDFLMRSAEVERKLEIVKEMLAEEETFTPASLFQRLDVARKGYLNEKDVGNFMRSQKIDLKGSDLKILFGRINAVKTEQAVRTRQFQNFILPNQNPRLRYFTMRRPVTIPLPNSPLDPKIQWITSKLFSQIITQYSRLMQYHQTLLSSFDFDADGIFQMISGNGLVITGDDLIGFVGDQGKEVSCQEVGCFLRSVDKRGEGIVYVQDFKHFFATLGLRKEHQIFDQLSPIPALKEGQEKRSVKDRDATLKERYKDNKSYVPGMDDEGHHVLGYSKRTDRSRSPTWMSNSRRARG